MQNHEDIEATLKQLGVGNYTILEDGSINVDGTVDISFKNLSEIPVKFRFVKGDFNCSNNRLLSLTGAPESVGVSFFCHHNRLATLEGGPNAVRKAYVCSNNRLISLDGAPRKVNGSFNCAYNKLVTLEGAPVSINGIFDCSNNRLKTLKGVPRYVQQVMYCTANPIPGDVLINYKKVSSFLIISDEDQ